MFSVALKDPKLLVPVYAKFSLLGRKSLQLQGLTHPKYEVHWGKGTYLNAKPNHKFPCEHYN